jgi:hypothetical protein
MMIGTTFSVQPYSDDIQFHFAINGIGRAVTFICQTCKSHNACVEEGRPVLFLFQVMCRCTCGHVTFSGGIRNPIVFGDISLKIQWFYYNVFKCQ